jgi:hypothetical protein
VSDENDNAKLTEIYGVKLKSEFADPKIYEAVRTVQHLLAQVHNARKDIKILEMNFKKHFVYEISHVGNNLVGYIARNIKSDRIIYLVLDKSRMKWMELEGFELTPENCQKVGTLARIKTATGFANFLGKNPDYAIMGYCTSNNIIPGTK